MRRAPKKGNAATAGWLGRAVVAIVWWLGLAYLAACGGESEFLRLSVNADAFRVQQQIVFGEPDNEPSHAGVVLLLTQDSNNIPSLCTGTLIASKVVLTAAHCVHTASDTFVLHGDRFGDDDPIQDLPVERVVVHPSYRINADGVQANDIALVHLLYAAPPNLPTIQPVMGREKKNIIRDGLSVELVGYGRTETSDQSSIRIRGASKIHCTCHVDRSSCLCASPWPGVGFALPPKTFCEAIQPTGVCGGDSGGPALIRIDGREYIAGVAAFADHDCKFIGCHTNVVEFESFIAEHAGQIDGAHCLADSECLSGYCSDGVCGEKPPTTIVCDSCFGAGTDGQCRPLPDASRCRNASKKSSGCRTLMVRQEWAACLLLILFCLRWMRRARTYPQNPRHCFFPLAVLGPAAAIMRKRSRNCSADCSQSNDQQFDRGAGLFHRAMPCYPIYCRPKCPFRVHVGRRSWLAPVAESNLPARSAQCHSRRYRTSPYE